MENRKNNVHLCSRQFVISFHLILTSMNVYAYLSLNTHLLEDPTEKMTAENKLGNELPVNPNYFQPTANIQEMRLAPNEGLYLIGGRSSIMKALSLYSPYYLIHPPLAAGAKYHLIMYRHEIKLNRKKTQVLMLTSLKMASSLVREPWPYVLSLIEQNMVNINKKQTIISASLEDIIAVVSNLKKS